MFNFQITVHDNILIIKKLEDKRSEELKKETKEYFKKEIKKIMEGIFVESDWELNGSQIAIFEDSKALKQYLVNFVLLLNKMHIYGLYKRLLKPYMEKYSDKIYLRSIYGDFTIEKKSNVNLIKHNFNYSTILNKPNDVVELSNHFKTIYPKEIFTNFCDYHIIRDKDISYFRDTALDLMDKLPKIQLTREIITHLGERIGYWHYFDDLDMFIETPIQKFYQGELKYDEIEL